MLRIFRNELQEQGRFIVTLELVPGRETRGRSVDTIMGIARDAFSDGRVTAVSITDNPGGNPSLSPDVIGYDIFKTGMDVIVHFTCRDTNRVGMESRALQLARMGMKNILALTGDYTGKGFGGQGAPVFDLDSVHLQVLLSILTERIQASGDPDGFFTGFAVSPFKITEGECYAQYAKFCRKTAAGAKFAITQLGYDARKFEELILIQQRMGQPIPTLGSVYLLSPKVAAIMNQGKVPGAVVTDALLDRVRREWHQKEAGQKAAVERAARLAAVLKGLGYKGIHIGGIHKSFGAVGKMLDRLALIEKDWLEFLPDFDFPQPGGFYAFPRQQKTEKQAPRFGESKVHTGLMEKGHFNLLRKVHSIFFNADSPIAPLNRMVCRFLANWGKGPLLMHLTEDPVKKLLLHCECCGDCAIQHVGFLCPQSGCPKHTRNGACGGSQGGYCEVHPERLCVWYRAYRRLASAGTPEAMREGCIPPRMWELDRTSAWLNFHLGKDHQRASNELARFCRERSCRL